MKLFIIYFAIGLGYWILILIKDNILRKLLGEEHKSLLDLKVGLFLMISIFQIIVWPIEMIIDIYIIVWCNILKRDAPWWVHEAESGIDSLIEEGTKED